LDARHLAAMRSARSKIARLRLAPRCRFHSDETTHFGYKTVPKDEKERLVRHVFENVASRYDVMNDLMSGGVHRVWKDTLVDALGVGKIGRADLQVLDVAGGTGDIAFRISRALRLGSKTEGSKPVSESDEPARIVISDINEAMLEEGRRRAAKLPELSAAGAPRLDWVVADARQLPFDDCSFDMYSIAFGIRNVTVISEALAEARRVLRPGGRFVCLEFSQVTNPFLRKLYEPYSFAVIPKIGELVANDRASYQYLVESIRKFPDQETFAQMIRDAGFRSVTYTNLTGGIVAIHSGFRLPE